jgi:hypothetical protein
VCCAGVQVGKLRGELRSHPGPSEPCPEWDGVVEALRGGMFGSAEDVGPILNSIEWSNDYYLLRIDFPSCPCRNRRPSLL